VKASTRLPWIIRPSTVYAVPLGWNLPQFSLGSGRGVPVGVLFCDNDGNPAHFDAFDRSAFALTTKNGHTRMYVGDGTEPVTRTSPAHRSGAMTT